MTYCQLIVNIFRIILVRRIPLSLVWDNRHDCEQHLCCLLGSTPVDRENSQLRNSLYVKRDDFNFHNTNFPFLSSNIPSSPVHGVFISQLIRYTRACFFYECFILRAVRLSCKLLGQGYVRNVWNRPAGKSMVDIGISYNIMKPSFPNNTWHSGTCSYTLTPSIDQTFDLILTLLPSWSLLLFLTLYYYLISGGFHMIGHLKRVRLADRGRLFLQTHRSAPSGACICSNVETILFELVMSSDLLSFEYPSALLFA